MTATERRRNMRADICRACGSNVDAYAGYLYRDTSTSAGRNYRRRTGRWGWFVKCEKCHGDGATRLTRRLEADRAKAQPKWSVRDVAKWTLETGHTAHLSLLTTKPGDRWSFFLQTGDDINAGEWRYIVRDILIPVVGENMGGTPAIWAHGPDGQRYEVAGLDFRGRFHAQAFSYLDPIFGRELTEKAAAELNRRIAPLVEQIRAAG